MATVDSIFENLGGPANAGRVMGVSTEHAATMRRRGSIPVRYWQFIVDWSATNGHLLSVQDIFDAHRAVHTSDASQNASLATSCPAKSAATISQGAAQ